MSATSEPDLLAEKSAQTQSVGSMFVLPRCRKPFATRSAKCSVEEVAEVFKADFWRCERLHIRCGAQARPAGARPEVSKLIRALLGGLAVYGCSNSHARGQSFGCKKPVVPSVRSLG